MLTAAHCGWGGWLGEQVGREGEVRSVGVLNDSYKLLPGCCCTQQQQWDMIARVY